MDLSRATAIAGMILGVAPACLAGEVQGVVRLEGVVPSPMTITIEPDRGNHSTEGCGSLTRRSQQLLVDPQGGVQNAVVWVETSAESADHPAGETVVLTQHECEFDPHVVVVPSGMMLSISNADPLLHNIRIFRGIDRLVEEWQHPHAGDLLMRFPAPGRYLVRCGVHSWMYAWVIAAEHRYYAVTDAHGQFRFSEAPVGLQTLYVWHEILGEQQQRIRVRAGRSFVAIRFAQRGREE